jgi:hypothetical protein
MLRLRHKLTGEVFGWNEAMAAQPTMEEFDDGTEDADAQEREKQTRIGAELDRRQSLLGRDIFDPRLDVNGDGNARGDPSPLQVRESRLAAGLDPETGAPLGHGFDLGAYEAALGEKQEEVPPHLVRRPDPGITPERAARVSSALTFGEPLEYVPPVPGAAGVGQDDVDLPAADDEKLQRPSKGKRAKQTRGAGRDDLDATAASELGGGSE